MQAMSSSDLLERKCAVCGEWADGEEPEDPMISCADCSLVVHAQCYGPRYITGGGDVKVSKGKSAHSSGINVNVMEPYTNKLGWAHKHPVGAMRCQMCSSGAASSAECVLCCCHSDNRSMKQLAGKQKGWAHIACLIWTPGPHFSDPTNKDDPVGLERVEKKRFALKCAICQYQGRIPRGAPLQCKRQGCHVAYHILCGQEAGWEKSTSLKRDANGDAALVLESFCGKHTNKKLLEDMQATMAQAELACEVCGAVDRPHETLLCDRCEKGYHLDCLNPALGSIPEGEWFCVDCASGESTITGASSSSLVPMGSKKKQRRSENVFFEDSRHVMQTEGSTMIPSPSGKRSRKNDETNEAAIATLGTTVLHKTTARVSKNFIVTGVGNISEAAISLALQLNQAFEIFDHQTSIPPSTILIVRTPKEVLNQSFNSSRKDASNLIFLAHTQGEILQLRENLRGEHFILVPVLDFTCNAQVRELKEVSEGKSSSSAQGLEWVLRSLTPNHRAILKVIVSLCNTSKVAVYESVSSECAGQLLTRSDHHLKQHLTELIDHGVIVKDGLSLIVKYEIAEIDSVLQLLS